MYVISVCLPITVRKSSRLCLIDTSQVFKAYKCSLHITLNPWITVNPRRVGLYPLGTLNSQRLSNNTPLIIYSWHGGQLFGTRSEGCFKDMSQASGSKSSFEQDGWEQTQWKSSWQDCLQTWKSLSSHQRWARGLWRGLHWCNRWHLRFCHCQTCWNGLEVWGSGSGSAGVPVKPGTSAQTIVSTCKLNICWGIGRPGFALLKLSFVVK